MGRSKSTQLAPLSILCCWHFFENLAVNWFAVLAALGKIGQAFAAEVVHGQPERLFQDASVAIKAKAMHSRRPTLLKEVA